MSALRPQLPGGDGQRGGVASYPADRLLEEIAFIAYYVHWPCAEVMAMDHHERQRWVAEISKINQRLNETR